MAEELRHSGDVSKRYANASIEVRWEPEYCIHSTKCWRNLGEVFKPNARPWINVDGASADRIAAVIDTCPSGALRYTRLDGGAQEAIPAETTVDPQRNGPLYVRGRIRVVDAAGNVVRETTRAALCRCGASDRKPFCDMSHDSIRFTADGAMT